MSKMCVWFIGLVALCEPACAVVVASGATNNTPPSGQPYFDNIGTLNGASAIFLADGWVLTANHVSSSLPASVNFGGTPFTTQPGSFHRLTNPVNVPTLSTFTDIVLFRLSSPPVLPGVNISAGTPTVGSQVMMVGNGRSQLATPTYWNRTEVAGNNNDTWVETSQGSSNISGFKTTATKQVRWGENAVNENDFYVNVGTMLAPVDVISFSTRFDAGLLPQEGQAVVGDSGGGVFSYNGASWDLSGMMFAVSTYETQPGGVETAVFGSETYIADLSYYRTQILTIIPEPSTIIVAMWGAFAMCRRRR